MSRRTLTVAFLAGAAALGLVLGMFATARSGSAQPLDPPNPAIDPCVHLTLPPPVCDQYGHLPNLLITSRFVLPTQSGPSPELSGGTPEARDLLQSLVDRLGRPPEIRAAALGPPRYGYEPAPAFGTVGDEWAHITVQADESGPGSVRSLWLASLLAGGYRELARDVGSTGLLGYSTTLVYPDGASHPSGGLIAAPIRGGAELSPAARAAAAARLVRDVTHALALASVRGAAISRADVVVYASTNQGLAPAVDVVTRSSDPTTAIRRLIEQLGSALAGTDGSYLVLRSSTGVTQYARGATTMTNEAVVSGAPGIVAPPRGGAR